MKMSNVEPILGRYLNITIEGVEYRLYFEEAGRGIPLLCLHTAGADGRQYRHLLNDPSITGRYRVIAFDMPYHGRSNPPDAWWLRKYRLKTGEYLAIIRAVWKALELTRPVVIGCSMGGAIVLKIAAEYQTELQWYYSQSGPGVYGGDVHFYSIDWDGREDIKRIDTSLCKVSLLTGQFDYSCTPDMTREVAKSIPGARLVIMEGVGHFPMIENYPVFRKFLLPELEFMCRNAG